MRRGERRRLLTCCALGLGVAVGPAHAQTAQANEAESWQFALTAYGYLPALSGTDYFPVPGTSASFNLNQSNLINDLKMTFMGAFYAAAQVISLSYQGISGNWSDLRAGATWMFNNHFGIGVGYDRFALHADLSKLNFTGRLNLGYQGLLIYVKGSFERYYRMS